MRWRQGTRSGNVEDRRGISPGAAGAGIGGIGLVVILLIAMAMGIDPGQVLQGTDISPGPMAQQSELSVEQQNQLADNVSLILGSTETTWSEIFRDDLGRTYTKPKLVLFSGGVDSACGYASSAVGPFYCPGDEKVYLDLDFFYDLQVKYGAPGDFAQAYVIAHEIGHHVQNLVGTEQRVDTMRRQASETEANRLSVALELQADCYAGVWADRASHQDLILDTGDLEEGLNAASAVGDDRLQLQYQGYVVPDAFTHGSSAQRVAWFRTGLDSGKMASCDTFSAS
jgi:predicted metalloprotease